MQTAALLVEIITWYLAIGVGVAAVFLLFGVDRIDPAARGSFLFRVLAAPGAVGLWPLVLKRWLDRETGRY